MNGFNDNTGIEVLDIEGSQEFHSRPVDERLVHLHPYVLQRLAQVFILQPELVLQELVEVPNSLCGADSRGVSLETTDPDGAPVFHRVAISGKYAQHLHALLPRLWNGHPKPQQRWPTNWHIDQQSIAEGNQLALSGNS